MHIIYYFTARAKKFPEVFTRGQFLNILKNLLFDKQLVPRNSPGTMFTQVLNRNPIKPVLFLERKFVCVKRVPVGFRTWFGSVHPGIQSYRS